MKKINFMLGEIIWQHKRAPASYNDRLFFDGHLFYQYFSELSVLQQTRLNIKVLRRQRKHTQISLFRMTSKARMPSCRWRR